MELSIEQQKELQISLTHYISLKHNKDECSGFIDGYKEALNIPNIKQILTEFVAQIEFDVKHETYEEDIEYYLKKINESND